MTNEVQPLVAVLDYGIGNLRSAQKALERVGADARLTSDSGLIADADAVVLPGVGAFGACMDALRDCGLDEVAIEAANDDRPFLGLGVLPGRLRRLPDTVKRPQMQWNLVDIRRPSQLFAPVPDPVWVYFVHSYAADADGDSVVATCDYGGPVAAAVEREGLWATQFHPEKSGTVGLELLRGFVDAARLKVGN